MSFLAASSAGIHPAVKAETPGAPPPPPPASGNVLFPQRFLPESSHKQHYLQHQCQAQKGGVEKIEQIARIQPAFASLERFMCVFCLQQLHRTKMLMPAMPSHSTFTSPQFHLSLVKPGWEKSSTDKKKRFQRIQFYGRSALLLYDSFVLILQPSRKMVGFGWLVGRN